MNVEEYLIQNQKAIAQECQDIVRQGSHPIITVKSEGKRWINKIGTVGEFTATIPDDKFFKSMRDGIKNAVSHKVIPIVVFEGQKAKIINLPEFELKANS